MTEIWKDINGFEGIYRISNQGNVLSVRNNIILKPYKKGNGYLGVKLQLRGKHIDKKIHRLVAEHFIENPHGYDEVNHIDENKYNNCADNLEWCCRKYNCNYGARNSKISEYQKLRHKMNKIEYLLDSCTAYPDDMRDCLVQIEKVVKE